MKRILIIVALALGLFLVPPEAARADAVTGQALSTDIRACINGQVLPCLIIEGRTAIVAEDLRSCGFDVIWSPGERKLEIAENTSRPIDTLAFGLPACRGVLEGPAQKVLATDIKTFLREKQIDSFNIDGFTAIYLSELAAFGEVQWDPDQREVRFTSNQLSGEAIIEPVEDANLIAEEIDRREGIIDFQGEKQYYQNRPVGYTRNGKAMISLDWMADWLGYQIQLNQNSYLTKRGSHSFRVKAAERQAQVFYDGTPVRTVELNEPPAFNSTGLYLYSLDLEGLFGLDSRWDKEMRQWKVRYADYRIKESGGYQGGSSCKVKAGFLELPAGFNILPELSVDNITLTSAGGWGSGDGQNFTSIVPLAVFRDNEIQICLGKKDRILFYKRMILRGEPQNHQLEKQGIIGAFTQYSLVKPEQGFSRINQNSFNVEGQVGSTRDNVIHIFTSKIDEASGKITELPEQALQLEEQKFSGTVALSAGPGLYRIHFEVQINGLHGITSTARFGEFYLDYRNSI